LLISEFFSKDIPKYESIGISNSAIDFWNDGSKNSIVNALGNNAERNDSLYDPEAVILLYTVVVVSLTELANCTMLERLFADVIIKYIVGDIIKLETAQSLLDCMDIWYVSPADTASGTKTFENLTSHNIPT
jgi:hypothetical protein